MSKRKTVLFLLSVLLAGWAVYSCSMDELEVPAFEDSGRYGGFGAREARAYFEAHATDLSVPRFDPKPGSKSSWRENIELIPEWGEAIETGGNSMRREYMAWLKEICKDNKVPTAIDQASFMEWCKHFGTYSTYSRYPYDYENESYGTGILMSLLEIIHDCF